ncbi:MAG: hypothetical protein IPL53_18995 [Ignavibacteria bacterium]|nr:hypothetical protein [Ignavibacteria bacterium]
MKTAISFFSVLVLTVVIGLSIAPEKSNAFSDESSIKGCVINGCAPAFSTITVYNSSNKPIETAHADLNGFFRVTQVVPGQVHKVVCMNGTPEIGCTAVINGVTCSTPQLNFCTGGVIWNCY